MNSARLILLFAVAMLMLVAQAHAATPQPRLATPGELQQIHDAGEYRVCLQHLARALQGTQANAPERYDLLLLRGDCLLHLEDPASARIAYASVAKSPIASQARRGRAMALLLQRSAGMTYLPRGETNPSAGISLANDDARRRALNALLADELRDGEADLRSATGAQNLVPIRDALPRLADLQAVEWCATGGDVKLKPTLAAVGTRARTLIDRELDLCEQTISVVETRANQLVDVRVSGWWWGGTARRGLYTRDRWKLRDMIEYMQRIEEAAKLGQELAPAFDDAAAEWEPLVARATKAAHHAQDVLDAE